MSLLSFTLYVHQVSQTRSSESVLAIVEQTEKHYVYKLMSYRSRSKTKPNQTILQRVQQPVHSN